MGIIRLQPKTMTVKGVVVKGKRNTVKVGLNKITVDVAHSYLQYMGKVTDVLGMIPGLTSDLQLLEGGTPTFVLNGRPVSMAELKAIPASQINKIVVDSNPTVEYSASNKGVVYITTKTALGNTLSTELSNTSIFARNYVDMANVSINEKYKKVSNILTAGFSYLSTTQIDKTTETVFLPQKDIESAKERHTIGNARMFEWFYSMNWEISRQQSFGFQYTGNICNTHIKEGSPDISRGKLFDSIENLYLCAMNNQGLLALAQLILPSEILSNFEVVRVEEEASLIRIYLDESVKVDYKENPEIESKGFCEAVTIRDFPIRDKGVDLIVRRRRWYDKQNNRYFSDSYELKAEGTRYSKEFAAFLKGVYGDDSYDLPFA